MILIPVKTFTGAKQRLASVLDGRQRAELARAMFEDMLDMLAGWPARLAVGVITGDGEAQRLAKGLRFEIIEDTVNAGESAAVAWATRACEERGERRTLVIPADIPLAQARELQAILGAAEALERTAAVGYAVFVPARDERGTNAALRCPPSLIPLRFGDDSFEPHLRAVRATGFPCTVLRSAGIELDVDRPADLGSLLAAETRTRSQQLLRTWDVARRRGPLERLERVERIEVAPAGSESRQRP